MTDAEAPQTLHPTQTATTAASIPIDEAAAERTYAASVQRQRARTDLFFSKLLLAQWAGAVLVGAFGPLAPWQTTGHGAHFTLWVSLAAGALMAGIPAAVGMRFPGEPCTRHLLAAAQMLVSSLLIYLTGGRIETHFHIFGSLALLSFYRDVRVLITATVVICLDNFVRGALWPVSLFGTTDTAVLRAAEHGFWILFETGFLIISIRKRSIELKAEARRQVELEALNREMESSVRDRTRALSTTEARFRALYENAPIGLYRANASGDLLMANPALLQILGYESLDEARKHGVRIDGHGNEARGAFFQDLLERSEVRSRDTIWRRRDGALIPARESARGICDERDGALYFEGSVEDVSERRQLEERYLQAQKVQAIGQLAGGVAHDFNNIITAILGYSDLVLDKAQVDAAARKYVGEIKRASERAAGLTQQLLAFSRKQTLQPRIVDLNTVVTEMDKMLRRLVGEHIHVHERLAEDLHLVKADPGQIQQVLMNLAVNARDAMPGGGNLTLETCNATVDEEYARLHPEATPGEYVMLAVSDNGIGMTADVKARLFEPFFTTKDPGAGTGLGLATCHGIVKQSGGHIVVYSEIGHGTTFKVYLPRTQECADAHENAAPAVMRGGNETVLLVEDEPMVRELGVLALESLGYRVYSASNGVEALLKVKEFDGEEIQLLVTDVVMPEMGGRELAEQIRKSMPGIQIIFSSGYTYDAIERTDLLEEGVYFVQKPYTMSTLAAKVRAVLEGAGRDSLTGPALPFERERAAGI